MSELWVCPRCGNSFATKNMAHSCGRFALDPLFARSEPGVRAIYDRLAEQVAALGAVNVIPQRSRVTFQSRVRFLSVYPRKRELLAGIWLRRRIGSHRFSKIEQYGPASFVHYARLGDPDAVDRELLGWIREARRAGLEKPRRKA